MLDKLEKILKIIIPFCFVLQGVMRSDSTLICSGLILQHLYMT